MKSFVKRMRIVFVLIGVLAVLKAGAWLTHVREDQGLAVAKWPFVLILLSVAILYGCAPRRSRME